MTDATTVAAKPTKLEALDVKLAAARATVDKLFAERNALVSAQEAEQAAAAAREAIDVTGLDAYTKVLFIFGRKENRKQREGNVVAFAPAAGELPARYKIEVGSGFDVEILTVPARDVTLPDEEVGAAE